MSSVADVDKRMRTLGLSRYAEISTFGTEPRPLPPRCRLPSRGARRLGAKGLRTEKRTVARRRWIPRRHPLRRRRTDTQRPARSIPYRPSRPMDRAPVRRGAQPQRRLLTPRRTDRSLIRRYLHDGVFYVKNPGILPRGRDSLAGASTSRMASTRSSRMGCSPRPAATRRGCIYAISPGRMTPSTATADSSGSSTAFPTSTASGRASLPAVPTSSRSFSCTPRTRSPAKRHELLQLARPRPRARPRIVAGRTCWTARLAHVDTAADFRDALAGGVDESITSRASVATSASELPTGALRGHGRRCEARRGARCWVVTTLGGAPDSIHRGPDSLRADRPSPVTRNLRVLRRAGVGSPSAAIVP